MEIVWFALIALGAVVGLAAVVGATIFLFLRFRAREPISIDPRLLLRLYLYVAIIAGLLVFTQGASSFLRAGMAAAFGEDFSYRPVFARLPGPQNRDVPTPLELKDRTRLTAPEREELSRVLAEREDRRAALEATRRRLGLERALEVGLIEGIGFTAIGALMLLAHVFGRRALELKDEREGLLARLYLLTIVLVFGVITIVTLPQAVFEALRFGLLDPLGQFGHDFQPGGKLALSITALPIWLIYLWSAIRAVRGTG